MAWAILEKKGCFEVFNMTQDTGRIRELKNNTAICDYSEHVKAVCLKAFRALILWGAVCKNII